MKPCSLRRHFSRAACGLLCCLPLLGHANDNIRFSGFASFGVAKSLERDEELGDTNNKIPHTTEYRDYNRFGFRMAADMNDNLTFTTQIVALGDNDFEPEFDWLFASYNFTPDLVLHVGKYVTSYYMYSDYFDVGYAYHWTRAPDAVYGQNLNKTLEGGKLVWNTRLGSWVSELSLLVGQDRADMSSLGLDTTFEMDDSTGITWQMERDWLMLRATYMRSKTSAELSDTQLGDEALLSAVAQGFTAPVPQAVFQQMENGNLPAPPGFTRESGAAALNTALGSTTSTDFRQTLGSWDSVKSQFLGLGTSMNFGAYFVIAEMAHVEFEETIVLGEQTAGYLTIGRHLPRNTALALTLYEKRDKVNEDFAEAVTSSYSNFMAAAMAEASNAALQELAVDPNNPTGAEQNTAVAVAQTALGAFSSALEPLVESSQKSTRQGLSLSGRWDFHSNAALKMEYLYEEHRQTRTQPNKTTPQAIRLGLDLVF